MMRKFLKSKIHHARVTHADLHYEGSITIPPEVLEASELAEFEAVHVWNVTRGTRLETYTIAGKPQSRDICINGAAAHLAKPGDVVIIASFGWYQAGEAQPTEPRVVFLDQANRIREIRGEVAGPERV